MKDLILLVKDFEELDVVRILSKAELERLRNIKKEVSYVNTKNQNKKA